MTKFEMIFVVILSFMWDLLKTKKNRVATYILMSMWLLVSCPIIDLHLIVDNYGSHKTNRVKEWLARHPRFHLHFTPTSASWLNMVERFFSEITTKKIRQGVFKRVQALIDAIMNFVENHNENPKIFTWTKDADTILAKVAKCTEALGAGR